MWHPKQRGMEGCPKGVLVRTDEQVKVLVYLIIVFLIDVTKYLIRIKLMEVGLVLMHSLKGYTPITVEKGWLSSWCLGARAADK